MSDTDTSSKVPADLETMLAPVIDTLEISQHEKEEMIKWIREGSNGRLEILLTGTTGVGKSTLVNALVGKPVAKVGNDLKVETKHVTGYKSSRDGVEIVVWDSPGLQDGSGKEEEYLAELKEKCGNVAIVIYCIKLSATRSQLGGVEEQNDLCAIKRLTATFGAEWWEHSLFVMTYANLLESKLKVSRKGDLQILFNERLGDWKKRIHGALLNAGVPKEIVSEIPVEPAGHYMKPDLPGRKFWLSGLWFTFLKHTKKQLQPLIAKANLHRLKTENDVKNEDFKKEGYEQPIVTDNNWVVPVATTGIGGVSGMLVGAEIGATTGLVGGPVGAAVGALVGGAAGLATGLLVKLWFKK